jgi:hypothetical protein
MEPFADLDAALQASLVSAMDDTKRKKDALDVLEHHVKSYGYFIVNNVAYDGNCFFHAVGSLIARTDVKLLRQELVTFLKKKVRYKK